MNRSAQTQEIISHEGVLCWWALEEREGEREKGEGNKREGNDI